MTLRSDKALFTLDADEGPVTLGHHRAALDTKRSRISNHLLHCANTRLPFPLTLPLSVSFIQFSDLKAIIFLNRFNRLVFVMEMRCVYCEIGTEILNTNQMKFLLQTTTFVLRPVLVGRMVYKRDVFLTQYFWSAVSIFPPVLRTYHLHYFQSYHLREGKRGLSFRSFQKKVILFKKSGNIKEYYYLS